MFKSNGYLDVDSSPLENKLRFVHNEIEDNLNELLSGVKEETDSAPRPYNVIKPDPGLCIKAFRTSSNEKCFINLCTSDGIPAPEDISTEQLTEILSSETPSNYKIPMSITELRVVPDKSGNEAVVCDVAIHPNFYRKVEAVVIFREFLFTIIFEALATKYNVKINRDTWVILKNRKCMGTLVKHRVQNRDVQKVYESYQNPTKDNRALITDLKSDIQQKSLITEIDTRKTKSVGNDKTIQISTTSKTSKPTGVVTRKPDYRLFRTLDKDTKITYAIAEFFLPEVMAQDEIALDLSCDRLVLEARRSGYLFDSFFPFNIDTNLAGAEFNTFNHVLNVKLPILV